MGKQAGESKILISGKVIKGINLGNKLGFPTANLDRRQFKRLKAKPKMGIYAGWAVVEVRNKSSHPASSRLIPPHPASPADKRRTSGGQAADKRRPAEKAGIKNQELRKCRAGIVIGPLDKTGLPKIEAHLIGFRGELYQQRLDLRLAKYLRPFRAFKNSESLKKAIGRDIQVIKKLKFPK